MPHPPTPPLTPNVLRNKVSGCVQMFICLPVLQPLMILSRYVLATLPVSCFQLLSLFASIIVSRFLSVLSGASVTFQLHFPYLSLKFWEPKGSLLGLPFAYGSTDFNHQYVLLTYHSESIAQNAFLKVNSVKRQPAKYLYPIILWFLL